MNAALAVSLGAALAEFGQACAAVLLSDWFLSHPKAEQGFQWAAIPVFLLLGAYLFFFAKPAQPSAKIETGSFPAQFLKGGLISLFNLLAIPYWFVYCGWLKVEGWWRDGAYNMAVFALGVSAGTMLVLAAYAWLGQVILRRSSKVGQYANKFIGLIFWAIGLKLLLGLW